MQEADSSSATMVAYRPLPARVAEYSQFTATHAEFLLYAKGVGLVSARVDAKLSMEVLAKGQGEMYLVRTIGNVRK